MLYLHFMSRGNEYNARYVIPKGMQWVVLVDKVDYTDCEREGTGGHVPLNFQWWGHPPKIQRGIREKINEKNQGK